MSQGDRECFLIEQIDGRVMTYASEQGSALRGRARLVATLLHLRLLALSSSCSERG